MVEYKKVDILGTSLITIVNAIKFVTDIDIRIDNRKREVIYLKKIYYKIAREKTTVILEKMGKFVHTSNHATVTWHLKTVDDLLETYPKYQQIYEEVLELIKNTKGERIQEEENKVVYFVDRVVQVKEHIEYVDRPVDVYETGIPRHIIDHLAEYTEDELMQLYNTRLKPYKTFLDINRSQTRLESEKVKNKRFRNTDALYK